MSGVPCATCDGSGLLAPDPRYTEVCADCMGSGWVDFGDGDD